MLASNLIYSLGPPGDATQQIANNRQETTYYKHHAHCSFMFHVIAVIIVYPEAFEDGIPFSY